MENLKSIKKCLIAQAQAQMGNLQEVDAEELGEVIDMIKDIEEAIYYCTITKAMEKSKEDSNQTQPVNNTYYYASDRMPMPPYYEDWDYNRDIDRNMGRMYYSSKSDGRNSSDGSRGGMSDGSSNSSSRNGSNSSNYYVERELPLEFRDQREGRSPRSRRMYMESKEMHMGKEKRMKELEQYLQELSTDITEMIEDASPEEKQMLQKKIAVLATKVNV